MQSVKCGRGVRRVTQAAFGPPPPEVIGTTLFVYRNVALHSGGGAGKKAAIFIVREPGDSMLQFGAVGRGELDFQARV